LEKPGKSDRDNVRCLTGVGGMAAVSRGWAGFTWNQWRGLRQECSIRLCRRNWGLSPWLQVAGWRWWLMDSPSWRETRHVL